MRWRHTLLAGWGGCWILAVGAVLAMAPAVRAGIVLHVDDDAAPGGDGLTWESALCCLQDALDGAAASGGTVSEIRVAQGVYRPDVGAPRLPGDRMTSFDLASGLTLKGGFAGVGAADPGERDVAAYETVLSGDLAGDDAADFANRGDNTYHVVVALEVDDTAVLDGFTVRGGQADGPGFGPSPESKDQGSGVNCYYSQPRLIDCTFEDNWAVNHAAVNDHGDATVIDCTFRNNYAATLGAGLYSHVHAATLAMGCTFIDNETAGNGGGAYNRASTTATYIDCHFSGNVALVGGGFFGNVGSSTTFIDCTFDDNQAPKGGAMWGEDGSTELVGCTFTGNSALSGEGGGGVWFQGGTPIVTDCTFVDNHAFAGGGLYNKLGAPTVTGCTFTGNTGNDGGGFWSEGGAFLVADCTFTGNQAETGGGMYNENSSPTVVDCTFIGNTASEGDGGGGITNAFGSRTVITRCTFIDNVANAGLFGGGGAVASYISSPLISDCTFMRNHADLSGGAMYHELDDGPPIYITNCAFLGNDAGSGGAVMNFRANPVLVNCAFVGNTAVTFGGAVDAQFLSVPSLLGCTIVGNTATTGGGAANRDFAGARIVNTIVWGNAGGEITGDPADVTYSCVEGGYAGVGNVALDPAVAAAPDPGLDGAWGTDDDDYGDLRLTAGSPAIDAGRNSGVPADRADLDDDADVSEFTPLDLGGAARFTDDPAADDTGCGVTALVDIGAYEFGEGAEPAARRGDVDGDGAVTMQDLQQLLQAWGACPADVCCVEDVDGDGVTAFSDLLALLGNWG